MTKHEPIIGPVPGDPFLGLLDKLSAIETDDVRWLRNAGARLREMEQQEHRDGSGNATSGNPLPSNS